MADRDTDNYDVPNLDVNRVKKWKKNLCQAEKSKLARLSAHATGYNCDCRKLRCSENVNSSTQENLLKKFISFHSKNAQDAYLSSLVWFHSVRRWRTRKQEMEVSFHSYSYQYFVNVKNDELDLTTQVQVCYLAFRSIYGITNRRMQTIKRKMMLINHIALIVINWHAKLKFLLICRKMPSSDSRRKIEGFIAYIKASEDPPEKTIRKLDKMKSNYRDSRSYFLSNELKFLIFLQYLEYSSILHCITNK